MLKVYQLVEDGQYMGSASAELAPTATEDEARRLIDQGGVSVDDEKLTTFDYDIPESKFDNGGYVVIRKGKKAFNKITK